VLPASDSILVLGDIGSTFTKLACVSSTGQALARVQVPTAHHDIARGVEDARAMLTASIEEATIGDQLTLCSSAGGGLRIVVIGLESELTVEAALRTSATAGGRVVAIYSASEIAHKGTETLAQHAPDVALLTGGTDGGDADSIARGAELLRRAAPGLPVVIAGNIEAQDRVRRILGNGRPVRFVRNVMPRVGQLEVDDARRALREMFVEHVMGHGRFVGTPAVKEAIRMPTPAAVLAAAEAVTDLGGSYPELAAPVIVDVGGATTDVHSVIASSEEKGFTSGAFADQVVTRTVEGDLGLRENAEALVESAVAEGYVTRSDQDRLRAAAERRGKAVSYVPTEPNERLIDEWLGGLAVAIALHRHAGTLKTSLTPEGAVLRRTGRDLRKAKCLILTGGLFEHSLSAGNLAVEAIRQVRERGGLIPERLPVYRDRAYLIWAAGLLWGHRPDAARELAKSSLEEVYRP
jgi:uncharacterized protein (TIGR01319 family)